MDTDEWTGLRLDKGRWEQGQSGCREKPEQRHTSRKGWGVMKKNELFCIPGTEIGNGIS